MDSNMTREEMWSGQCITLPDVNYNVWEEKKKRLQLLSDMSRSCFFTVDVYKGVYSYASTNFTELFGFDSLRIGNIEQEGDLLEERIHPEDQARMIEMQIRHGHFIYSQPIAERNNFQTIYQFRMLNTRNRYVNVVSRQQVLQEDRNGKAWIIMGMLDMAPEQTPLQTINYSFVNTTTGELYSSSIFDDSVKSLTKREREILLLIRQGLLSKEIAGRLNLSIHTVHNHRKNILLKLDADNSIEAIHFAEKAGLLDSWHPL